MHNPPLPGTLVVIGCGGVASYLLPALLRTIAPASVILHDGDTLEERNLDRQLFDASQIGQNKAEALAELLRRQFHDTSIAVEPSYFHEGTFVEFGCVMVVCVDNHTARRNALYVADQNQCLVVLAGNEYTDSQGMVYLPGWRGTPLDPRVRYPEIMFDNSDDPRRPESCQGAAQLRNPQLAMANFGAANFALWLLWFWIVEARKLDAQTRSQFSPIEHSNNFNRFRTTLNGDVVKQPLA